MFYYCFSWVRLGNRPFDCIPAQITLLPSVFCMNTGAVFVLPYIFLLTGGALDGLCPYYFAPVSLFSGSPCKVMVQFTIRGRFLTISDLVE